MKNLILLFFAFVSFSAFSADEEAVSYQIPDYDRIVSWGVSEDEFKVDRPSDEKNGFRGYFVITNDAGWEEKWREQPLVAPNFSSTKVVKVGERVGIIPFVANPKFGTRDFPKFDVWCNIVILRPDGTVASDDKDRVCYNSIYAGDPKEFSMSPTIDIFEPTEEDQLGVWKVKVRVWDVVSDTVLFLNQSFVLEKKAQ